MGFTFGMGLSLTNTDVLSLLKDSSIESRLRVASGITKDYLESKYSKEELRVAEEILRLFTRDAEVKIRATISEALKSCNFLPHDIAFTLAKDVEEVSIPMIQFSEVLTDKDFEEIIGSHKVQKILAISRRQKISDETLKNLVLSGFDEVIDALIANDNLNANSRKIIFTVTKQTQLPIKLNEKIMSEVSARIVQQINAKYKIGFGNKLEAVAGHATEISVLSLIDHQSRTSDIEFLVEHLDHIGKLTHSIILSSMCMGKRRFFISAVAKKAGITMREALIHVKKEGRDGLRLLLTKAGLPEKLHDAIELVVRLTDEKKRNQRDISVPDFCAWLVSKLEYFADRSRIEYLNYLMAIAKQTQIRREAD